MTGSVDYTVNDEIATITMNDPDNRNALSRPLRDGLHAAFRRFESDSRTRVAILTGAGNRAFTAGGDLKDLADPEQREIPPDYLPLPNRNIRVSKPWIAAVNGYAVGGGVLYTMLADMAVAADTAKFCMPEAGLCRGAPWSVPLARQIPRKIWFEMAITGEMITAQRAAEVGLVNYVVGSQDVFDKARELAERVVRAAPLATLATMKMIRASGEMGQTPAWDTADELFRPVYASSDAIEGPRAWLEKRQPQWQGR